MTLHQAKLATFNIIGEPVLEIVEHSTHSEGILHSWFVPYNMEIAVVPQESVEDWP